MFRDYAREKKFITRIAERLKISRNGNHAGAVVFSNSPKLEIKLSDHSSVEDFNKAVEKLPLLGGTTRIDLALKMAFTELFALYNGMRVGSSRLLIVLTDGKQTTDFGYIPLHDAVRPFHESGIKVIVIGIGSKVDRNELSSLVVHPKDLFLPKDFDELLSDSFFGNFTLDSCMAPGLHVCNFFFFHVVSSFDRYKAQHTHYINNIQRLLYIA